MAFIFDGFLSKTTQGYLERAGSEYSHALYAKNVGRLTGLATEAKLFRTYPVQREDCMGRSYNSTSHCFCVIHRNSDDPEARDGFLLLRSQTEHAAIVAAFPDEIINATPFKTVVGA